jgi:hypothetical protein
MSSCQRRLREIVTDVALAQCSYRLTPPYCIVLKGWSDSRVFEMERDSVVTSVRSGSDDFHYAARAPDEHQTDNVLRDSFPASDPPSWVAFARIGCPARRVLGNREVSPCVSK